MGRGGDGGQMRMEPGSKSGARILISLFPTGAWPLG
jgi:hypothetical protein